MYARRNCCIVNNLLLQYRNANIKPFYNTHNVAFFSRFQKEWMGNSKLDWIRTLRLSLDFDILKYSTSSLSRIRTMICNSVPYVFFEVFLPLIHHVSISHHLNHLITHIFSLQTCFSHNYLINFDQFKLSRPTFIKHMSLLSISNISFKVSPKNISMKSHILKFKRNSKE